MNAEQDGLGLLRGGTVMMLGKGLLKSELPGKRYKAGLPNPVLLAADHLDQVCSANQNMKTPESTYQQEGQKGKPGLEEDHERRVVALVKENAEEGVRWRQMIRFGDP